MSRCPIVPDGNIACIPTEADNEFRTHNVFPKELKYLLAFTRTHKKLFFDSRDGFVQLGILLLEHFGDLIGPEVIWRVL